MSGTVGGGKIAGEKNKRLYGEDFYKVIGRKGGILSRGGGWTGDPTAARIAGAKGGAASRRGPIRPK